MPAPSRRFFSLLFAALAAGAAHADDGLVATPKGDDAADSAAAAAVDDAVLPAEQKEAFKLFTGTWTCAGKANTDLAADTPLTVRVSFKPTAGGRWLAVHVEEDRTKTNPKPTISDELWGSSATAGGLVMNGVDNKGGFHLGSSTGWVGDRFAWMVDTSRNQKKVKVKSTFTKDKAGKPAGLELAFDPTGTGDGFRVVFEGTCRR